MNNDISSSISLFTNNITFYDRNTPRHIKRLHNQRNGIPPEYRKDNYKSFQKNNMIKNNHKQQNIPVHIKTPPFTIVQDTNFKLLELNKILDK